MSDKKEKIRRKVDKLSNEIDEIQKRIKELEGHDYKNTQSVKDVGLYEIQGRRKSMEDNHCVVDGFRGNPYEGFFGVFDGHGGKMSADYVADHLHLNFAKLLDECKTVEEATIKAYKMTDYNLSSKYNSEEVGTTVVTCYITEYEDPDHSGKRIRRLYSANCGDARAVLSRNGVAFRVTKDHKATLKEEQRRVEDDSAIVLQGYLNMKIAVSRAIGDSSMKRWVICDPFFSEVYLKDTDDLLIIACDGVWDVMSDEEAVSLLRKEIDRPASVLAQLIVDKAFNLGSSDNITAIVIKL